MKFLSVPMYQSRDKSTVAYASLVMVPTEIKIIKTIEKKFLNHHGTQRPE